MTLELFVTSDPANPHRGTLRAGDRTFVCALGKAGLTRAKQEGDHATPTGIFPLRRLYFRSDRIASPPATGLPTQVIGPVDGWCDDPSSVQYNRPVTLPFAGSHERLWRDDGVYDLIVEIGYNDDPPVPGRGSAIFLHIARPDFSGTEGCVALARGDLLSVLADLTSGSRIHIG